MKALAQYFSSSCSTRKYLLGLGYQVHEANNRIEPTDMLIIRAIESMDPLFQRGLESKKV
jgi:hypothetical protein